MSARPRRRLLPPVSAPMPWSADRTVRWRCNRFRCRARSGSMPPAASARWSYITPSEFAHDREKRFFRKRSRANHGGHNAAPLDRTRRRLKRLLPTFPPAQAGEGREGFCGVRVGMTGPLREAIAGGWHGGNGTRAAGPRCVALVGPFQSGKTTLLEAILTRTGSIQRQGNIEAGNTVGDASKEARHHRMSVELSAATTNFMGDTYTFLDCPGSVEFVHDMRAVLPAIDVAVVVCEMDEKKVPQLQLILRELEDKKIPRILFVNKIDKADAGVHDVLQLLQPASRTKLVLRQIPTLAGDLISGFVDLALERAFVS